MAFVYRNFPLTTIHPHAEDASESAEAAGVQGAFWEMHDTLFENQNALEYEDIAEYARTLGLDAARLMEEVLSKVHLGRIRADFQSGVKSGVNGTPTLFINAERYDGPRDPELLIEALTDSARSVRKKEHYTA